MTSHSIALLLLFVLIDSLCHASKTTVIVGSHYEISSVQSWSPLTIAVNSGNIWFNNRDSPDAVIQLNSKGKLVAMVRTSPASNISAIAIGPTNQLIYLADDAGRRIVLMTPQNEEVASFPYVIPIGHGVTQLVVDREGTMYILDDNSDEVWRINATGAELPCLFSDVGYSTVEPAFIAVDSKNVIYVADKQQGQIHQFSPNGDQLGIVENPVIHDITALAIDSQDNMLIAAHSSDTADSTAGITKLSGSSGTTLSFIPHEAKYMAIDVDDSLFISDSHGVITMFDNVSGPARNFRAPTPFATLIGIMVDSTGNLFVINDDSLTKVSVSGSVIGFNISSDLTHRSNYGVIGSDGYLYISDTDGNIQKILSNGTVVSSHHFGALRSPLPVRSITLSTSLRFAVASDGSIWVPTKSCQCIIQYSAVGVELKRLLSGSNPTKMFVDPSLLQIDVDDNLFVVDVQSLRVYKLTPDGDLLWAFSLKDHCLYPSSFTIDVHGDIYIADSANNHFIHILRSQNDAVFDYVFDDFIISRPIIAVTSDSTVYVSDAYQRVLVLMPKSSSVSSGDHRLVVILSTISVLVLLTTVGIVMFRRFWSTKQLETLIQTETCSLNGETPSVQVHASRRDRTARTSRRAETNFLNNFHDNLRSTVEDNSDADYVLFI